jgi:hypothetical protein
MKMWNLQWVPKLDRHSSYSCYRILILDLGKRIQHDPVGRPGRQVPLQLRDAFVHCDSASNLASIFPKMEVPPNHPFFFRMFHIYIYFSHYKPSRCLGSTILGNPHVSSRTLLLNVADFVILCWLMICITATDWNSHIWLVVWSFFYFSIYLEQSSHLTNIFQRGWHHKPVKWDDCSKYMEK